MDNLAKILNLVFSNPGAMQPCFRVHRASERAARDYNAVFKFETNFQYLSSGVQRSVSNTQNVSASTFQQQIDSRWSRVRGTSISLTPPPDSGTPITCQVQLVLLDGSGTRIETSDAEVSVIRAP